MRITWLGHASFLIEAAGQTIYIDPVMDPFASTRFPKATIVLISHWHPDHCTRESVERVRADETAILGTADAAREFNGCKALKPGDHVTIGAVSVLAMEAKTTDHIGGHDEEGFVLGFVIQAEGKKLYYTSDTDFFPAMVGLAPDVVLIPVGGTTTMGPAEAAKAVHAMQAKLAIPTHWGTRTGTRDDADLFKEYLEKEYEHRVAILEPGEMITL